MEVDHVVKMQFVVPERRGLVALAIQAANQRPLFAILFALDADDDEHALIPSGIPDSWTWTAR